MKTAKFAVLILIGAVVALTFITCFDGYRGGDTTLTLNLGGQSQRSGINTETLERLAYSILLSGPEGVSTAVHVEPGQEYVQIEVFEGLWDIAVYAYLDDDPNPFGQGFASVNAIVGQNTNVGIQMEMISYKGLFTGTWPNHDRTPIDLENGAPSFTAGGNLLEKAMSYIRGVPGVYTLLIDEDFTTAVGFRLDDEVGRENELIIMGIGSERKIQLAQERMGHLFHICINAHLTLGNNVTLVGVTDNNYALVSVDAGSFTMLDGSKITGNAPSAYTPSNGGGVYVISGGTFTMKGGIISDNKAAEGGGVYVFTSSGSDLPATFIMEGGTITNNTTTSTDGGGVYLGGDATFIMSGGTITDNEAADGVGDGGGVYLDVGTKFTMTGGIISNNSARQGGGAYLDSAELIMSGGEIHTNHAITQGSGGGVALHNNSFLRINSPAGKTSIHSNTSGIGVSLDQVAIPSESVSIHGTVFLDGVEIIDVSEKRW